MKKIIAPTHEAMSRKAADYIIRALKANPTGLYCFAGGDTPVATINHLVDAHIAGDIDLKQAYFIELDEWVGLDKNDAGSCADYLFENLFDKINLDSSHYHLFETKGTNLEQECEKANRFIADHGGLMLSLLGVGVNGHLGFNEPGTTSKMPTRVVELDETTTTVGKKYFETEQQLSQGITLGLKELLASQKIIVLASGASKVTAMGHFFSEKITPDWPVTLLKNHDNLHVFLDKLAAEGESLE